MSFKSFKRHIRNQLAEVIRLEEPNDEMVCCRYASDNDEIKNASKLIIDPGFGCILVYEGSIRSIFTEPGLYNIETDNHPFITTLLKLRTAFESEHKLQLYFFRTTQFINIPWGTPMPIKYIDPQYNLPVELGMSGNFSCSIADPEFFFLHIVAASTEVVISDIREAVVDRFCQEIASQLAEEKLGFNEIDSKLADLSATMQERLLTTSQGLGIQLIDFRILGSRFDDQTQARIARISNTIADNIAAREAGLTYAEMEKLKAMRDAARNEGGVSGAGMQMGLGLGLGQIFADTFSSSKEQGVSNDVGARLKKLDLLLSQSAISQEEYDTLRKKIIDSL